MADSSPIENGCADDPATGWSGEHQLLGSGPYRCACGRSEWPHADTVRTHIEWALREQNHALWNAGQRVCNDAPGAVAAMSRVLDLCRPLGGQP